MRQIIIFLILLYQTNTYGQGMPEWFKDNMKKNIGTWIADNTAYKNANEPFDQYGIKWEWALDSHSIKGVLWGLQKGKEVQIFWEFRQYWDFKTQKGIVEQFGLGAMRGIGEIKSVSKEETEMIQEFILPNGKTFWQGHKERHAPDTYESTSFDIKNEVWEKRRTYIWVKK